MDESERVGELLPAGLKDRALGRRQELAQRAGAAEGRRGARARGLHPRGAADAAERRFSASSGSLAFLLILLLLFLLFLLLLLLLFLLLLFLLLSLGSGSSDSDSDTDRHRPTLPRRASHAVRLRRHGEEKESHPTPTQPVLSARPRAGRGRPRGTELVLTVQPSRHPLTTCQSPFPPSGSYGSGG